MTDSTAGLLALDCGRTTIWWSLTTPTGRVTGSRGGIETDSPVEPQIAEVAREILDETGGDAQVLACGSSGLDRADPGAALAALSGTSIDEVHLAHHSTTSYLGALGDGEGVMITSNTGVVALAVAGGQVARVDGWGWVMGEAGSAYWIGRNALEAAMRGYDGRRQSTLLTDLIATRFDDLELAYLELQGAPDRVARVASYATLVDEAAHNDPVARNILDKAAAHLAEAVVAAAHRVCLGRGEPPTVCALGRTFESARVLDRFVAFLRLDWPAFELTEPQADEVVGAERLVTLHDGPLAARVARARR